MTIWITTNGRPSESAALLAKQPGFARARMGGKIKSVDTIINWGSSTPLNLNFYKGLILNPALFVEIAADKLDTFEILADHEVKTVEWTSNKDIAKSWLDADKIVVARTKLTGHSGQGIIIVEPGQALVDAPLYTKYVFKKKEFRVHVVGGNVIDTTRKIKDPNKAVTNWKIRSYDNGFIFARNGVEPDPARDSLAVAAVHAVGLDFGAVDIIQDKKGIYYVLEINTAPGIEGQTITKYAEAFRGIANQ